MRIGVDAVLLGAWVNLPRPCEHLKSNSFHVLDVGTGCGVIALMVAQRCLNAIICAIDVDKDSVVEAEENFRNSPWRSRLSAYRLDFTSIIENAKYDLIISNPPYFNAGINDFDTSRKIARHEGSLSPVTLLRDGSRLLNPEGRIAMVIPCERVGEVCDKACKYGLSLSRLTNVRGRADIAPKRSLLEFVKSESNDNIPEINTLVLEKEIGKPTDEHLAICRDFYLKF